jgi:FtsZ-binding cell division protein ZapB
LGDNSDFLDEERSTEGVRESEKDFAHEDVAFERASNRRQLFQKVVSLLALGAASSLLLGEQTRKTSAYTGIYGGVITFPGDVLYEGTDGNGATSDPWLFWDFSNQRLGINLPTVSGGPGTPLNQLDVRGDAAFTGPVGIGTNNPARMLHLYGSGPRILIEDNSGGTSEVNFRTKRDTEVAGGPHWSLYEHGSTSDLRFWQTGDKVTLQTGTGNVGIGTTNPGCRLHVESNVEEGVVAFVKNTSPYCPGPICVLTQTCGLAASTENVNAIVRMAGVQGDAYNGAGVSGMSTNGNGVEGMSQGGKGLLGAALAATAIPIVAQGFSSQTANLQEWQNNSGVALSVVDKNGYLGIGTMNPALPLEVAGTVKSSLGTAIGQTAINASSLLCASQDSWTVGEFSSHSTAGNPQFYFYRSRGTRAALAAVAAGDYIGSLLGNAYDGSAWGGSSGVAQIRFVIDGTPGSGSLPTRIIFATTPTGSNSPSERLRITNAGYVGVGTTSPAHLIQLSGGAYSDGSTWNPSSSIRWKENITPLTDGIETLKQLRPVSYNYKKTPTKTTMGFIAEDVGKVLPTVVDWDQDEVGYAEGYDPLAIIALTVEAVKEQQRTFEEQQRTIERLQAENNALKARMDAYEQIIKTVAS